MSQRVPEELRYTASHEWVKDEGNGIVSIGITHHAQSLLGDLVYVEMPDIDSTFKAGEESCVVESVKAAADVYSPVSGSVLEINPALVDEPGLVNLDPYGDGWLFKMRVQDSTELKKLLTAEKYMQQISDV